MSNSANDNGFSEVALAIRRYLEAHPNAADSHDGILRWWITLQRYADSASAVQAALDELEARGLVSHKRLADGRTIYQRNTLDSKNDGSL